MRAFIPHGDLFFTEDDHAAVIEWDVSGLANAMAVVTALAAEVA